MRARAAMTAERLKEEVVRVNKFATTLPGIEPAGYFSLDEILKEVLGGLEKILS